MNRNVLYVIVVLLLLMVSALGYFYYQETKTTSGVDITVDDQGLSIQKK